MSSIRYLARMRQPDWKEIYIKKAALKLQEQLFLFGRMTNHPLIGVGTLKNTELQCTTSRDASKSRGGKFLIVFKLEPIGEAIF